ncbi:MAG: CDP-diacylglycerol--serine O-phosphatidyltransferase [Deltaproteobacteria bacterium]|nr:CDP-diacylglycerol--serine O-phosphatidyltransferase [Deltaproteobacteria bacterium]
MPVSLQAMRRPPFQMIRSFHLADLFTLANAFCGMGAVFAAMSAMEAQSARGLVASAAFIPLALFFDVLDGNIARWRRAHSAMGRELDSLADVISFGVAPAALAYAAGMRGLWDCFILTYFVACGVSRLARFNVTAEALSEGSGKVKFFEGTPIPTSIALVGVVAWAAHAERVNEALYFGSMKLGPGVFHPLVVLFAISGSLMISTIRIPKF